MYNIAIVGATGLVGQMFLKVLEEKKFPIKELHLFASEKSIGKEVIFNNQKYCLEALTKDSFKDIDFALFSAGGAVSLEWAKIASESGAIVIDNSSAWRMHDDVALIVPEINLDDFKTKGNIIANPNCSTIQVVLPLKALSKINSMKRINFNTYQAVSGSGFKGLNDYQARIRGEDANFYPYDISKTCIPQIDSFLENGYTKEEMKMVNEVRKILHMPNVQINATCIRVPVEYGHGVSVSVEFQESVNLSSAKDALSNQAGVKVLDGLPTSIHTIDNDDCYVGRLRKDLFNDKILHFYCVANNIRRGAASNAVLIALGLIKEGILC